MHNEVSTFTQTALIESLGFEGRRPQHVLPTVIDHLLTCTKEIVKLKDLREEWKFKSSTWSEWTFGLAKKGSLSRNHL